MEGTPLRAYYDLKMTSSTINFSSEKTDRHSNIPRWIFGFLMIGFIWVVVTRFTQVETLMKTLAQGRLVWILAALLFQVINYAVLTATNQSAFSTVGVQSRLLDLIPVTLGAQFANVVAPSGGASGAALFIDDAARRGQSPSRVTAGLLLQLVSAYFAFTLILAVGLAFLFFQHDLNPYEVAAAIAYLLITLAQSGLLLIGYRRPDLLRRLLAWVQRVDHSLASKFHRGSFLPEDWAEKNTADFSQAAEAIYKNRKGQARIIGLSLTSQALDLVSLYALFMAFSWPISFGPLVAGYAMGMLFSIIAIPPGGIGMVEGVMVLVYGSLGIPQDVAVIVSLAFRGLAFWLPLGLGFISIRRVKSFGIGERSRAEGWSVRLIALFTALLGVLNVFSAVTPAQADRLALIDPLLPLIVQHGGRLAAALSGFALLILADGIGRRKRTAWILSLVVLIVSIISHLIAGLYFEESLMAAGLALWLLDTRDHYQARSDPPSVRQGLRALCAAASFTLVYGVAGFYLLDFHYSVNFSFWDAVRQTILMFSQFADPGLQPVTGFGRYFAASIYVVGAVTLFFALLMLLRPVIIRQPAAREERERARRIVEAHGRSSLARYTLFEDKSYFFSSGGSVIAYAQKERVAVALGDPIGPVEDVCSVIGAFKEYCAKNDWQPAFYQVLPDHLGRYREAGYDVLCIGQEGIVDLQNFTLEGKPAKDLRYSYSRFSRLGYEAKVHEPPLANGLLAELRGISDEWLKRMHGTEKRFSLGWFEDDYIRNSLVMAVHTPDGSISAFANINPEYQRNEASVDLMRHKPDAENGTMDYLFVSLFLWAKSKGYETFNLGLSGLSGIGETPGDLAIERALHYIYEHVNQFYNFKGLHAYKAKFHPLWSPRYLIYPGPGSLPPVTLALIQADSGENPIPGYIKRKISGEQGAA
jgi:phosphatidylglycerol lysyltransferase